MSHITGTVQVLGAPMVIGPGTTVFNPPAAPGGTKFLILHFQNLNFLPGDKLEVKLGYATDTFTSADGPSFWTRPVNVYAFPAGVEITYVAAGPGGGSVQLDQYGRGERHNGEVGHPSFSNCDPFYQPPSYLEPTYDPWWFCVGPPSWENAAKVTDPSDVRARVARSVGMILSVELSDAGVLQVSTCSVTLVDADTVITAGHCHQPSEAPNSSVIFNYQTAEDGSRPGGYSPYFIKVKSVIGHKNLGRQLDYSLLRLAEAPVGIPAIQMRHDLPALHEAVFGVHHPNGAVKKLSLPHASGFSEVTGSSATSGINVPSGFHVSGGSSGSGLFDTAGRILGVLSRGNPCHDASDPLAYCPTRNILLDLEPAPPPAITRDVMLVVDRSGSMSMDDGTGRTKIEAARDAVSLFVQLVKAGTGNRAGLVSFSTAAALDAALANVTAATKTTLVGPAPFSTGKVGALVPGGATSIGGGLDSARTQLVAGSNPRSILLMTDGLQNTPPMIADVDGGLAALTVHAIGFGTESSLDGALLTTLTSAHGGQYMRAGGGLALEKFFSSAFGNIFEAGVLFDPEFALAADASGAPIAFDVCGEDAITAIAGWDNLGAQLLLEITTPGGAVLHAATAGVESSTGRSWAFLRVPLPVGGERNGAWSVRVVRPGGGGEFPPPKPALRYFVSVIPSGGPKFFRQPTSKRHYTGDVINPLLLLRYDSGEWPADAEVSMTVTRPSAGVGNILAASGLGPSAVRDGDVIPARYATLQGIETSSGAPVATYGSTTFDLANDSANTEGLFEPGGTFGKALQDFLTVEGNYTFHAKAIYGGDGCSGMRELVWSLHVDVGIDPGSTTVTTTTLPPGPDGGERVRVTFTPRDKYGNLVGPGRSDGFSVDPLPGSTPTGLVIDLGNGSYQVDVALDPGSLGPPGIQVTQPGRDPVSIAPSDFRLFIYSVKFVCGTQKGDCCECAPVRPGRYSTEINIHNPSGKEAPVLTRPIALTVAGAVVGREPRSSGPGKPSIVRLPPHAATMSDCCRILELVLGAPTTSEVPLTLGILEIVSTVDLNVTAVYTVSNGDDGVSSIDVEQIRGRNLAI